MRGSLLLIVAAPLTGDPVADREATKTVHLLETRPPMLHLTSPYHDPLLPVDLPLREVLSMYLDHQTGTMWTTAAETAQLQDLLDRIRA